MVLVYTLQIISEILLLRLKKKQANSQLRRQSRDCTVVWWLALISVLYVGYATLNRIKQVLKVNR